MRAEQRHKMHRNDLAEWLGEWNRRIKPYSNVILIVVLAIGVGIVALAVWLQRSRTETASAWDLYYRAVSAESVRDLEDLTVQTQAPKVGHCAALVAADMYLAKGCQELFENKSVAGDDLRKAVEHYRMVQDESREAMLLQQACFGLARAYEALAGTGESSGALEEARQAYAELVDNWPNGPYAELASRRLQDLDRHDTKAFYDQFAQFDPQQAQLGGTRGVPGGSIPFDEGALSEGSPLLGPAGSLRPDWTEETEAPPSKEDSSEPGEAAAAGSEGPTATPQTEQAGPELMPAEGAAPPEPPSTEKAPAPEDAPEPKEAPRPEKPAAQGPSGPGDASTQDAPEPEAPATSEPAPAEETPGQPPPPAEEAPDPGPSPTTEPSEPSP